MPRGGVRFRAALASVVAKDEPLDAVANVSRSTADVVPTTVAISSGSAAVG